MSQKQLIVTFPTTAAAMATEQLCHRQGLPGHLMTVPRQLSADCGLAWCAPTEVRPALESALQDCGAETEGIYEIEL